MVKKKFEMRIQNGGVTEEMWDCKLKNVTQESEKNPTHHRKQKKMWKEKVILKPALSLK